MEDRRPGFQKATNGPLPYAATLFSEACPVEGKKTIGSMATPLPRTAEIGCGAGTSAWGARDAPKATICEHEPIRLARAICATGDVLSVGGQLRLVTIDVDDWSPAMEHGSDGIAVVILRDATGDLVPYKIADSFSLADAASGAVGDYTALVRVSDSEAPPIFVRALDAEVPSFVGITDATELERVTQEYEARLRRASFRIV